MGIGLFWVILTPHLMFFSAQNNPTPPPLPVFFGAHNNPKYLKITLKLILKILGYFCLPMYGPPEVWAGPVRGHRRVRALFGPPPCRGSELPKAAS